MDKGTMDFYYFVETSISTHSAFDVGDIIKSLGGCFSSEFIWSSLKIIVASYNSKFHMLYKRLVLSAQNLLLFNFVEYPHILKLRENEIKTPPYSLFSHSINFMHLNHVFSCLQFFFLAKYGSNIVPFSTVGTWSFLLALFWYHYKQFSIFETSPKLNIK